MALDYPSRSAIRRASYHQLRLWYNELGTPRDDIEKKKLDMICECMAEHEVPSSNVRGGCVFAIVMTLIAVAAVAFGAT